VRCFLPPSSLRDGDYADLQGASLVMITAGANEKTGGATDRNDPAGRLRLLDTNVDVYKDIVPRLHAAAPQTLVLVVGPAGSAGRCSAPAGA
jgi:L-lactate dehydrogenase